jgi:hypothetical protein
MPLQEHRNEKYQTCYVGRGLNVYSQAEVLRDHEQTYRKLYRKLRPYAIIFECQKRQYILFHSFIYSSIALQPFVGPWPLHQSHNLFYTEGRIPWTGDQPSQGRYLRTEQHKRRINAHTDIHPLSGIGTQYPSIRATIVIGYNLFSYIYFTLRGQITNFKLVTRITNWKVVDKLKFLLYEMRNLDQSKFIELQLLSLGSFIFLSLVKRHRSQL